MARIRMREGPSVGVPVYIGRDGAVWKLSAPACGFDPGQTIRGDA